MLELTQKEIDSRCEIGKIEGVPIRFFGDDSAIVQAF